MKTISKEGKVLRVDDRTADAMRVSGWNYCPKSEWKKVRGTQSVEELEASRQATKQETIEKTDAERQLAAKKKRKDRRKEIK